MLNSIQSNRVTVSPEAWLAHYLKQTREKAQPVSVLGLLTPALAELLLERNPGNRALSETKISNYCRDIRDGNFVVNGETVIISADGLLNDGQHRCHAVRLTDKPIETFFVFGVSRDTRATVDQGKARTAGDFLSFDGIDDANTAAAVGGMVHQYREHKSISRQHAERPTRQQLRELFNKKDGEQIQASIDFVGRKGLGVLGGRSVIAFCHYIIKSTQTAYADYFFSKLITGEELKANDPIFACRTRLLNSRRLTVNEKAELIFRAWNFFREGKPTERLSITGKLPRVRA